MKFFLKVGIITLSIFLYLYNLGNFPGGMVRDEAALGYNSFSILQTGRDEHGQFLPINLESFGDWKLPLYSYLSTLPIKFLGLTIFTKKSIKGSGVTN